jgi:hypothetical protein
MRNEFVEGELQRHHPLGSFLLEKKDGEVRRQQAVHGEATHLAHREAGGAKVISADIGVWCRNRILWICKSLNFEKEAHLNRSEKAKPTASPQKPFFFCLI